MSAVWSNRSPARRKMPEHIYSGAPAQWQVSHIHLHFQRPATGDDVPDRSWTSNDEHFPESLANWDAILSNMRIHAILRLPLLLLIFLLFLSDLNVRYLLKADFCRPLFVYWRAVHLFISIRSACILNIYSDLLAFQIGFLLNIQVCLMHTFSNKFI